MSRRRKPRPRPIDMPICKVMCQSCAFRQPGMEQTQQRVTEGNGSLMCHETGHPTGTHLCRGARDVQLRLFTLLGFLPEPTDAAWLAKWRELYGAAR